ncbi:carbohydrate ABC transporter permease [Plantactinospora sp. WMMB782]|uniref:carbohydrate ABC transporter permease n=1 Tax=Plantactinospora sp. WMMB782 TaxID=3404121 RepID=UPI003B961047
MSRVAARRPATGAGRRRRGSRRRADAVGLLFALVWVFPVYWMINTAFKPRSEALSRTPAFVPAHPTAENFVAVLTQPVFLANLRNSLIVVSGSVLLSLALGLFAATALARFRFRGRRVVMTTILVIQMLPATALLIPTFLVFNSLGLLGTYAGLILSYVASVLPITIWLLRGFLLAIPKEVEEAAMVDGASDWRIIWRILFPLVTPGIVATSVFAFVSAWNDFIVAYTFTKDQSRYTLPVWLASFATQQTGIDYSGLMAASALFSVPVMVFFLIVQRNLVRGVAAGAVKG